MRAIYKGMEVWIFRYCSSCFVPSRHQHKILVKMKIIIFTALFVGYACAASILVPAATIERSPEHDSAIIQSDRFGGNFAYSTAEGHAYKTIQPIVTNVIKPVAINYQYQTKLHPIAYTAHVPLTYAHGIIV